MDTIIETEGTSIAFQGTSTLLPQTPIQPRQELPAPHKQGSLLVSAKTANVDGIGSRIEHCDVV